MEKEYTKMKTPLQELIEKVEHAIAYNLEGANVKKYTWEDLHYDMYNLLEEENEFIEDVFVDGLEEEYQFHVNGKKQIKSYDYYNQKYK